MYGRCYGIAWNVEKIQKIEIQRLQGQKTEIMVLSKCARCGKKKSKKKRARS